MSQADVKTSSIFFFELTNENFIRGWRHPDVEVREKAKEDTTCMLGPGVVRGRWVGHVGQIPSFGDLLPLRNPHFLS